MTVEIKFDDNDHIYTVDLIKIAPKLGITEEQIRQVVIKAVAQS